MDNATDHNHSLQVDVILRSADGHDFRFYKYLLSLASPVFDTMFALPQPSLSSSSPDSKDGLPVVELAETKPALQRLLGMYLPDYLEKDGKIASVDEWKEVFSAANKYEMKAVVKCLSWNLESLAEAEPMRVFALATQHGLNEAAQKAAFNTLKVPFGGWGAFPELECVTGGDLQRLFQYHTACGRLASSTLKDWFFKVDKAYCWYNCSSGKIWNGSQYVSNWWQTFTEGLAVVLEKKPLGATVEEGELASKALVAASLCPNCRTIAPADMERFRRAFAARLDEEMSKIVLESRS
ncbi:hypothetical protein SERLA73DRAFT_79239 [Serpula lacrymans var. lacrymans S7.3]|uniref:BTB domain-containing protein n=1 Tax=Serpula lacrymans var. lacrymans (strain S7.3) TaxID=936435 RepID=F8QFQ6_SERL3|nr:hypothetical protein SERLA73DRAFT_79239 [Serpula lacrymans var. lacrymans S7.3]